MEQVVCETCGGDGIVMGGDGEDEDCPECNGEGYVDEAAL